MPKTSQSIWMAYISAVVQGSVSVMDCTGNRGRDDPTAVQVDSSPSASVPGGSCDDTQTTEAPSPLSLSVLQSKSTTIRWQGGGEVTLETFPVFLSVCCFACVCCLSWMLTSWMVIVKQLLSVCYLRRLMSMRMTTIYDGFFLLCDGYGRTFDSSFPTCAF